MLHTKEFRTIRDELFAKFMAMGSNPKKYKNTFTLQNLPDLERLNIDGIVYGKNLIHGDNLICVGVKYKNIQFYLDFKYKTIKTTLQAFFRWIDQYFPIRSYTGSNEWKIHVVNELKISKQPEFAYLFPIEYYWFNDELCKRY